MLSQYFRDPLTLRIAQATLALLLVVGAVLVASRFRIRLTREGMVSTLRGMVQIVGIGSLLLLVFRGPVWSSLLVLGVMIAFASSLSSRRAKAFPQSKRIAMGSIALGSLSVLGLMVLAGVVPGKATAFLPIGSMLIANAMTTTGLVFERLLSDTTTHRGTIEAALSLGAEPNVAIQPYVQSAVRASLIPRLDTMRSLGIVWIPGLMTGMLLSGSDPLQAALYQFVIVAMILSSGVLSALCCGALAGSRLFTPHAQLCVFSADSDAGNSA